MQLQSSLETDLSAKYVAEHGEALQDAMSNALNDTVDARAENPPVFLALRHNLNRSRRAALLSVIQKNGELHQKRCMMAETIRQAELGAKVATAKESTKKREKPNAVE